MTNSTNMPEKDAESANSTQSMPAEFGLPTATFVVIAGMVGAGVLTTSGYTVALVGSNQWMLFLWVLGGITAVCGALTLAELSAALPRTGGDYVYLYEAYGPLPAFLSGWVSFFIGFAGPERGVGFRVRQIYPSTFSVCAACTPFCGNASWLPSPSWFLRRFTSPDDGGQPGYRRGSPC